MTADALFTFDAPNESEMKRLRRREYDPDEVVVIVINFDDLRLRKVENVSKFAGIHYPSEDWEKIASVLPIRIERAAGDVCIISSLVLPRTVRIVVLRDGKDAAIDDITSEMAKCDLAFMAKE